MTVVAIILSVGAALALNYSMYMQKKAVGTLPQVQAKLTWDIVKAFFTNRYWLQSISVLAIGGGLYVVAIGMAPVSIVQPIVASGVALLAYLAIKNLGEKPRRIDLYAIGLTILGVILIGVSMAEGIPEKVKHDAVPLWILTGVMVFLAVAIPLLLRGGSSNREAAGLGISVGLLYGIGAVFARLLIVDWGNQWASKGVLVVVSSIFGLVWLAVMVPGFIEQQAALQRGMAIIVVPILAGLSQLVPIFVGTVALNEAFPKSGALVAVRILAFLLILVGTIILSKRAEEAGPSTESEDAGQDEVEQKAPAFALPGTSEPDPATGESPT